MAVRLQCAQQGIMQGALHRPSVPRLAGQEQRLQAQPGAADVMFVPNWIEHPASSGTPDRVCAGQMP